VANFLEQQSANFRLNNVTVAANSGLGQFLSTLSKWYLIKRITNGAIIEKSFT